MQPNPCPIPKAKQDLAPVQRAIDSLAAQQATRREEEEKQRQLRQQRERNDEIEAAENKENTSTATPVELT